MVFIKIWLVPHSESLLFEQDDVTNDEAEAQQCQVWGLLLTIFSSERVRHLAKHHWNCPLTSKFLLVRCELKFVDIAQSTPLLLFCSTY